MTAILVDYFQGEIFVHTDGIVMADNKIIYTNKEKSTLTNRAGLKAIATGCGKSYFCDKFREIVQKEEFNIPERFNSFGLNNDLILVTAYAAVTYRFNQYRNKPVIEHRNYKKFPQTYGSGTDALKYAYQRVSPRHAKTVEIYLEKIEEVFNIAVVHCSTMTKLTHTKRFKA